MYSKFFLDICTGKTAGTVVVDANNPASYSTCGECSVVSTNTCPTGKKYDIQCNKCVTGQFLNCKDTIINNSSN